MTRVFTDDGRSVPVTIVQANPNLINKIKTQATDGYDAIQVLTGQTTKNPKKPDSGQIKTNPNEKLSHKLHEFRLSATELEQVDTGKEISLVDEPRESSTTLRCTWVESNSANAK